MHDKWEDEEGRDESWTYLVATDAPETPDTPGTDLPEGQSPLANVFTGKLLKQMGGDQFFYENGYLTKIVNGDETTTFHYNYATGAEGPDVYVTMTGDGDDEFDITLNEQGFAEKVVQTSHDQYGDNVYTKTFEYDADGHLTAMNDDRNGRLYDLTWTDGDLTKVHWLSDSGNEYTYSYAYGNQPNSNCLLLYYKVYSVDIDEVQCLYYAGLLGKAPKNLPETETSNSGTTVNFIWTDNSLLLSDDSQRRAYDVQLLRINNKFKSQLTQCYEKGGAEQCFRAAFVCIKHRHKSEQVHGKCQSEMQKGIYYRLKGHVLQYERPSFGG